LEKAGIALLDESSRGQGGGAPLPPINEAEANIVRARNVARTMILIRIK
jgi:hypothetical protein